MNIVDTIKRVFYIPQLIWYLMKLNFALIYAYLKGESKYFQMIYLAINCINEGLSMIFTDSEGILEYEKYLKDKRKESPTQADNVEELH